MVGFKFYTIFDEKCFISDIFDKRPEVTFIIGM